MNKKTNYIAVVIAVALVLLLVGSSTISKLFTSGNNQNQVQTNQLQSKDIQVGKGDVALPGKEVTVNYTGILADGKKFDSSLDRGVPFKFVLGAGQVIKGWDIGVEGMKVGGKRILIIPPELAYGANAVGPIPANSTLIFEIELLGVK